MKISVRPWLSFIPSLRKWAIRGQSVLGACPVSIFHSALLTEFFEGGNMSSWKKICTFQISLAPRGGHVIEYWPRMHNWSVGFLETLLFTCYRYCAFCFFHSLLLHAWNTDLIFGHQRQWGKGQENHNDLGPEIFELLNQWQQLLPSDFLLWMITNPYAGKPL